MCMLDWQHTLNPKVKLDAKVRMQKSYPPAYLPACPTNLTPHLPTLNPKGKFDAKVRVRSDGRNPFALHAVWMKAGEKIEHF